MASTLIRQGMNTPFHSKEEAFTVSYVYSTCTSKEQIRYSPYKKFC